MDVDERELDDAVLHALAEAYATPPPPALRSRVLGEARREAAARDLERRLGRWRVVGSLAAAAALVLGGLLARETRPHGEQAVEPGALARANQELQERFDQQSRSVTNLLQALNAQGQILQILGGARTLSAMLSPKEGGKGSGHVLVDAASGNAALVVSGLGPLPEGQTYQLWAIRGDRPPEPAGLFAGGAKGEVAAHVERVERPGEVTAFAVSIEPGGGSESPTGPIVLVGPVSG